MNRHEFLCFADFLLGYLKPEKSLDFFKINQSQEEKYFENHKFTHGKYVKHLNNLLMCHSLTFFFQHFFSFKPYVIISFNLSSLATIFIFCPPYIFFYSYLFFSPHCIPVHLSTFSPGAQSMEPFFLCVWKRCIATQVKNAKSCENFRVCANVSEEIHFLYHFAADLYIILLFDSAAVNVDLNSRKSCVRSQHPPAEAEDAVLKKVLETEIMKEMKKPSSAPKLSVHHLLNKKR